MFRRKFQAVLLRNQLPPAKPRAGAGGGAAAPGCAAAASGSLAGAGCLEGWLLPALLVGAGAGGGSRVKWGLG